MAYQNYTITTPLIDVEYDVNNPSLPTSYTRVMTPKKGYVIAAVDFTHGDLTGRGINTITFTDTTTPYAFDNKVEITYDIPSYNIGPTGLPIGVSSNIGAGTYFLSAEIKGNAVKSGVTWSGIVSVRNKLLDNVSITTDGSEDSSYDPGTLYTGKAITVNVEPGKFSELFRVKFTAITTNGGQAAANGQTSIAGQCFYKGFVGFEIQTKDTEQYRVQRENIVFDGSNIIEFELAAYANIQSSVDFFSFQKFTQENRSIHLPGFIGAASNVNVNSTFVPNITSGPIL